MTEFLDRFLADYFAESEEHLMTVRRALLSLEDSVGRERPAAAVTEELFRTFHSIKGIAAMVEHRETEQLAHEMVEEAGAAGFLMKPVDPGELLSLVRSTLGAAQ